MDRPGDKSKPSVESSPLKVRVCCWYCPSHFLFGFAAFFCAVISSLVFAILLFDFRRVVAASPSFPFGFCHFPLLVLSCFGPAIFCLFCSAFSTPRVSVLLFAGLLPLPVHFLRSFAVSPHFLLILSLPARFLFSFATSHFEFCRAFAVLFLFWC